MEKDSSIKVVIFDSANPDFFMAHADLEYLVKLSADKTVTRSLGLFHTIGERMRTMPKVTIAKIAGRARGGGSELSLAMDMRFAVANKTILAQPEIGIGIIPAGGGTQRLPRLIGRARALEVILSGGDFSAELAERYGYINRAIPENEIDEFVDSLAERIAGYTQESIQAIKLTVNASESG
ncbi:enoyl-CoA hydratase/isomerase family protein [Brenneria sp. 4F2]|nr:enoyl-CoA hydratase/isomerase family protein [Brenneria bubanii]